MYKHTINRGENLVFEELMTNKAAFPNHDRMPYWDKCEAQQ